MSFSAPTSGTSSSAPPMIYTCTSGVKSLTVGLLRRCRLPRGCGNFCFFDAGQTLCRARFFVSMLIAELAIEEAASAEDDDPHPPPSPSKRGKYHSKLEPVAIARTIELTI
jgi:hypothetical protein